MQSIKYNKIQIIKNNSWQLSNSYMFWHQSAILRESTRLAYWTFFVLVDFLRWHSSAETCRGFEHVMNCILWFVFYCILLIAFVGWYSECKNMHGMSNIKFEKGTRCLTLPLCFKANNTFNTEYNSYRNSNMVQSIHLSGCHSLLTHVQ